MCVGVCDVKLQLKTLLRSHLQWDFHTRWISADLRMSWTTPATSTWAQRRASRWECGRLIVALSVRRRSRPAQAALEWTEASWLHEAPLMETRCIFLELCLFVPFSFSLSFSLPLSLSKAHAPCQPMGGGRWEESRLVPGGPGRRASCYHLPPWQRRDQVG